MAIYPSPRRCKIIEEFFPKSRSVYAINKKWGKKRYAACDPKITPRNERLDSKYKNISAPTLGEMNRLIRKYVFEIVKISNLEYSLRDAKGKEIVLIETDNEVGATAIIIGYLKDEKLLKKSNLIKKKEKK